MMSSTLGVLAVFVVTVTAVDAGADPASPFAKVKTWKGTITVKVDDTDTNAGTTTKTNSAMTAKFGPIARDAELSTTANPVWSGKLDGLIGVSTKNTTSGPAASVMTWAGNGAIAADSIIKLSIDFDKATYEVHVFTSDIGGTQTVELVNYHQRSSQADGVSIGSFTRSFPLPSGPKLRLEQHFKCSTAACPVTGYVARADKEAISVDVVFEPEDTKLRAVPGGPYAVERGEPVTLDGSGSTGDITKYTWKVTPGRCPDAAGPPAKEHEGVTWSFTPLCSGSATLTVTDGTKTDQSRRVDIGVSKRGFITEFSDAATEIPLDLTAPFWPPASGIVAGENRCAPDPEPPHTVHPPADGGSWDQVGYTLTQVSDDGPFDTYWYVDTEKLKVTRQIGINKYFLPGGPKRFAGGVSLYDHNQAVKDADHTDIDGYLGAVRDHEHLHSTRMQDAIKRRDPAKQIEQMVTAGGRDALKRKVDTEIQASERAICNAAKDPIRGERGRKFTLVYQEYGKTTWYRVEVTVGGKNEQQKVCD